MSARTDTPSLPPATGVLLDAAARDDLAVKNLDLVGRVVGRLPISMPPGVDRDDLISVGTLGLLTAARNYQPMRGASFRTFAYLAIRSAVLDELRRADPLPRGARAQLRTMARIESDFRAESGRLPTPAEIADRMHVGSDDVELLLARAEEDRILRSDPAGAANELDEPADPGAEDPSENASQHELIARVEAAIVGLSQRERQVIVLYHSEGLFLKEIGETLGVTESRVCQILACAQQKIRAQVGRDGKGAAE